MTVDTVEFLTSGLELTFEFEHRQFTLAGMVGVSISGIASLSVTFGHTIENSSGVSIGYSPGLVDQQRHADLAGHDDQLGHDRR